MKQRQMAIIKGVHFGVGDRGSVCMWFSAHVGESGAALQVLSVPQAVNLLKQKRVNEETCMSNSEIKKMNEHPSERAASRLRKGMSHADYKRIIDEEYKRADGTCKVCGYSCLRDGT